MDLTTGEIDDSLYSRQRYVLGDDAMRRLSAGNVAVFGLGGLGLEIAKNVILCGAKSVALIDSVSFSSEDATSNFYYSVIDDGQNRATGVVDELKNLNFGVDVYSVTDWDWTQDDEWNNRLSAFSCVVLTECCQSVIISVNNCCRNYKIPVIKLLVADCFGLIGWVFADFGDEFVIEDFSGEEPKEFFIGFISRAENGVVRTLEGQIHGLQTGDCVCFREVSGMEELNGISVQVKVIDNCTFSIGETLEFSEYRGGGIGREVKVPKVICHEKLHMSVQNRRGSCWTERTSDPSMVIKIYVEYSQEEHVVVGSRLHMATQALLKLRQHGGLPKPWNKESFQTEFMPNIADKSCIGEDSEEEVLLRRICYTAAGYFPPLFSVIGGIVAQEVLKALTRKFQPLSQFFYLDCTDCAPDSLLEEELDAMGSVQSVERPLTMCLGPSCLQNLERLKLFMVGCGAIGCELLKIFAMIQVGAGPDGIVSVTDNDLIEKSNLNRQFLFRPCHIQQPKSVVAASTVRKMNSAMNVRPLQLKVCKETEDDIFTDDFFASHDVIVNALDSVEARLYVDSRCVSSCRPLFESGTLGTKGHVQVILPHVTESYSSQRDPPELETPFCTLKSFPTKIEHTIQWARNKFESLMTVKPKILSDFWASQNMDPKKVLELLKVGRRPEGFIVGIGLLVKQPECWKDCVELGRLKFEKYFNHKARQLLSAFPQDCVCSDGSRDYGSSINYVAQFEKREALFWQSPKRPPVPVVFDPGNQMHLDFVISSARLFAKENRIQFFNEDFTPDLIVDIIQETAVPEFVSKNKKIAVDENDVSADSPDVEEDVLEQRMISLEKWIAEHGQVELSSFQMDVIEFEKDDDLHIDFITAASNLRAVMYQLEPIDRFLTKKVAGRIIPAISTTTACVSGENLCMTVWDKINVTGHDSFTLKDFIEFLEKKYECEVSMVALGEKPLFLTVIENHKKRLKFKMTELCFEVFTKGRKYVDLIVSLEDPEETDSDILDNFAPLVRYYFEPF